MKIFECRQEQLKLLVHLARTYITDELHIRHLRRMIKQGASNEMSCVCFIEEDYDGLSPMVDEFPLSLYEVQIYVVRRVYELLRQLGFDHNTASHNMNVTDPVEWPQHLQMTSELVKCYWM